MRKQDQLNALIRSLNKNEKRYFKLQASLHSGDKTFTRLFDELAKSDTYEPEILSKKLGISKPVLGHVKVYLEKVLLSTLRLYEQDHNVELELTSNAQIVKILFERNQIEFALSVAEKTLEKAIGYESFLIIIGLLRTKINLLTRLNRWEESQNVRGQKHEVVEQLREEEQIWNLLELFFDVIEGRKDDSPGIEKISEHPIFNLSPEKLRSNLSRIVWHFMKQIYYYLKHEMKLAIHHAQSVLQLYQAQHQLIYIWPSGYLTSLSALSNYNGYLGNFVEAIRFSRQMETESDGRRKDIPVNTSRIMHSEAQVNQVYWFCLSGKYEDACKLEMKIASAKPEMVPHLVVTALHHIAVAKFSLRRFDQALEICEEVQSITEDAMRVFQLCNRLLVAMIHYELKNYRLLPYLLNSAGSWAKRHQLTTPGTKEILRLLRKLGALQNVKEQQAFFIELEGAMQGDVLNNFGIHLGIKDWIHSNLKG